jgi:uncharacterized glyoxalase superfamily protein PhnB
MAKRVGFRPTVFYQDPKAAMAWLEKAFGFDTAIYIEGADGSFQHCQMRFGEGLVSVGQEWDEAFKSPRNVGGKNTQTTSIHIDTDVDAHCERARAAGARIITEPTTQFYGDRSYQCEDPEGHRWFVGQTVETVTREQGEQRMGGGMKITGWV